VCMGSIQHGQMSLSACIIGSMGLARGMGMGPNLDGGTVRR
jgi:hypothetical protein